MSNIAENYSAENAQGSLPDSLLNLVGEQVFQTNTTNKADHKASYSEEVAPLNQQHSRESKIMADLSREEIDAKLQTVEARSEIRFVELSSKLDRVSDTIVNLNANIIGELATVRAELSSVKADNKYTRLTIIIAIVATVLAGVAALWSTQANLLSAFQSGIALRSAEAPPITPSKK